MVICKLQCSRKDECSHAIPHNPDDYCNVKCHSAFDTNEFSTNSELSCSETDSINDNESNEDDNIDDTDDWDDRDDDDLFDYLADLEE